MRLFVGEMYKIGILREEEGNKYRMWVEEEKGK